MATPSRITAKDFMHRYGISQSTAVRWRRDLRVAGLLVGVSPNSRTVVGDWSQIDQAVLRGAVGRR